MTTVTTPGSNNGNKALLVNTCPVLLAGLKWFIEKEVEMVIVGHTADGREALRMIAEHQPRLVITDLTLQQGSGIELIRSIRDHYDHRVSVLVLSTREEMIFAERAYKAGANGYIMADAPLVEIAQAIHQILRGENYASRRIISKMLRQYNNHRSNGQAENNGSTLARLTNREMEIFELIGQGKSVRDIARFLSRSVKTIEAHREHIKQKLNLSSSNALIRLAAQWTISDEALKS